MHIDIIVSAFAKAKKEELKETGLEGSTNRASERISAYISEVSDIPYSSRSLRNALNDASDPSKAVEILQPKVLNALCMYLGYDNYQDYIKVQGEISTPTKSPTEENKRSFLKRHSKWIALFGVMIIIGLGIIFFSDNQRWMEWDTNHYVEVSFNAKKLQEGTLKLYKKDRIENFRKVSLTCDSVFFNANARPNFWYGKNSRKQLEYFTGLAKHPETGKSLKPLSQYMINKYICVE